MTSLKFTKAKGSVYENIIKECLKRESLDETDSLMVNVIAEYIRSISEDEQVLRDIGDKLQKFVENTINQCVVKTDAVTEHPTSTRNYDDEESGRLKPPDITRIGLRIPEYQYDIVNPTGAAVVELTLGKSFFDPSQKPRRICCSVNIDDNDNNS